MGRPPPATPFRQASGARISHSAGDRAFYRPSTDSITLPEKSQFESADRYYATALHELGHWTGHPSRLDRDLAHPFGSEGYAKEELRAEISSMIVGDELGIGHDPEQHAAYVGSWIKALQDDPLEIFRASSDAEKIHDYVLAFEQKQVQEQQADLRQPHEMTLAEFAAQATTEKLENHGRQWNVTLGDRYSSFSDAENPEAAIADVHRGTVNNALYLNTPGAAEIGTKPTFPPAAVLAEYPDLVAQFPDKLAIFLKMCRRIASIAAGRLGAPQKDASARAWQRLACHTACAFTAITYQLATDNNTSRTATECVTRSPCAQNCAKPNSIRIVSSTFRFNP